MATKRANTSIVNLADGRQVLYSYGVAVAAFAPAHCLQAPLDEVGNCMAGYFALDHSFSVTTSKHVNQFTDRRAVHVSPARFAELISPLAPNYPAGVM